jgi:iron complex outermembrane receptor protein
MTRKFVRSLLCVTMLTKVVVGSAVSAREADPSENARRADAEIIVTGLRPDEGQHKVSKGSALGSKALLDTPYSVTIVDADDIARRHANSIAQIFANDPSVYSSAPSGSTNWWGHADPRAGRAQLLYR